MISLIYLALVTAPPLDKVAHFGVSFAATSVAYSVCKAIVQTEEAKTPCLIAASVGALGLGIGKEILDGSKNTTSEHLKDMGANVAGIGLSAFTISIAW